MEETRDIETKKQNRSKKAGDFENQEQTVRKGLKNLRTGASRPKEN